MGNFLLPAAIAGLTTFLITPWVITLARYLKLVDDPKKRLHPAHTHTGIIPRAGGLALFVGFMVPVILFLPLNKTIVGICVAAFLTVLIGLFDDLEDLSPYVRFIGNIATAVIVVAAGTGIPFITNPLGGVIPLDMWRISFNFFGPHSIVVLADLFAIIWIVWTMNIVGWSSGVDGQMPGFVVVTAAFLGIVSLRFTTHDVTQSIVTLLAFITAGTFLGFLPWNFFPQKIMPGYGGKTLAGLLLATIAILSGGKVGSALLLLAIPMIDALYSLLRRIMSKKSPFRADRNHLHHHLLDLGWGKRRIALFYWVVSFILGLLTLLFTSQQKIFALVMVTVMLVGIIVWVSKVVKKETWD
jgi:UDP-GlcNAc:undecaprenyl-phosphate GlcNAc-1-phosphate transferase